MYNNDLLDEIEVEPGQAHEYEERFDKMAAARAVEQRLIVVNAAFAISRSRSRYTVMKWSQVDRQWCYVISTVQTYYEHIQRPLTNQKYMDFTTEEEAREFIAGMTGFFQWLTDAARS